MAGTTQSIITVDGSYASLGTTPAGSGMLISPEGEIMIVAATSQPAANTPGHHLGMSATPFLIPFFSTQLWAISAVSGRSVAVSVTY